MQRIARRVLAGGFAAAMAFLLLALAAAPDRPASPAARGALDPALVKRGEYLVSFGGCNDCHTPWVVDPALGIPLPDLSRRLSGHPEGAPDPASTYKAPDTGIISATFTAFGLPFGIVYAPNLTPDPRTGLGGWTEDMFVRAMRTGRHMGGEGRPILPPMPWQGLAGLTDQDLSAVFAYLRSIPAIANEVPAPKVPDEVIAQLAQAQRKMAAAHGAKEGKATGPKKPDAKPGAKGAPTPVR